MSPWYVTVLGVFATSVLINTIPFGVSRDATVSEIAGLAIIVVIQTIAIGGGTIVGAKLSEQYEQRRKAASRLYISEATVKTHLLHIYAELGVNDRAAAVAEAFERGLLTPGRRSSAPLS